MKNTLFILLLSWVYLLLGNPIHTLEDWNQTSKTNKFNFTEEGLSQLLWSKHGRYKRNSPECPNGQAYDDIIHHCCRKCPEGQYVEKSCDTSGENPTCAVCKEDSYLKSSNYRYKCIKCKSCDHVKQVEVEPCTPKSDRKCKCKEGYYEKGGECYPCKGCPNRNIKENCSSTTDAECGVCLPNFFEENNTCQPCNRTSKDCKEVPATCTPVCVPVKRDRTELNILLVIFPVLLLVCALVGLFLYKYKFKKDPRLGGEIYTMGQEDTLISSKTHPEESILLTFDESPVPELCSASNSQGQVPSVLQKGCALYDIIDCVPVKRWKELMRNLELPDNEIERVEMEVGNFRDQQYEMLRRWCQLKTASVESVYQALDRMHLSGCSEKLKSRIERYS